MKAARAFVIALTLLAVGFGCGRSPTGLPEAPAPGAAVSDSTGAHTALSPTYDHRTGNYAVAW